MYQHLLPQDYKPVNTDILCGRGKACAKHAGNKRFKAQVCGSLQRYAGASKRLEKSVVVSSVVKSLLVESGLRFIKFDQKTQRYFELTRDQAHDKTGHAIRDFTRSLENRSISRRKFFERNKIFLSRFKGDEQQQQTVQPDYSKLSFPENMLSSVDSALLPPKHILSANLFDVLNQFDDERQKPITPLVVGSSVAPLPKQILSIEAFDDILDQIEGLQRPTLNYVGNPMEDYGFDIPSLLAAPLPIDCDSERAEFMADFLRTCISLEEDIAR